MVQDVTMSRTNHRTPRTAIRFIGIALIGLVVLLTTEIGSFIALRFVVIPKDQSLIYIPPEIDRLEYERYMELRHPVLGWAPRSPDGHSIVSESRPIPSFPSTSHSCVSLYGDSFTFSDGVKDEEAWSNVLSQLLGCKVANFGVGGYGMDQAYLRFSMNERDQAPVTVLGIYPYNILRNLNQYRFFLAGPGSSAFGLKPRFVIDDDRLRLIPLPTLSYEDFVEMTQSPTRFFQHETFLPGSPHGPPVFSFPYTVPMLRLATSQTIRNYVLSRPSWLHYLEEEHSTGALKIAAGIAQSFANLARERGKRHLVVIFPTVASFNYFKRTGTIATQPLSDALQRLNIDHFDVNADFSEYLGERSYCEMMNNVASCSGHYNAEGNRVIAQLVHQHMEMRQMR